MGRVNRRAARVDANQADIVKALRKINGVTVELGMDDLLIGYKGVNYWIELKEVGKEKQIKPHQAMLAETWEGQYLITSSLDEILELMGIK